MVPEGWRKSSLEDVARIQTGVAKGKRNIVDPVEMPYLRVANVQDGYLDLDEIKRIEVASKDVDRYRLEPGDIVLTEGGDFDKLGRGTMWEGQVPDCLHQNHVFAVRVDREKLLPEFFAAQTNSGYGKGYFLSCAKRSTNLASINSTQLKQFPALVPPLPEQRKIADILSTWDRAIETTEALLTTARTQKRALMQSLLTGKRRFPEFEGQAWHTGRLVDHFDFINGRAFKPEDWGEVGLPIIRIQNLTGSTDAINYFDGRVDEKHMVREGDFLLSWSATLDTFIWHGDDAVLNQHIFKVVPHSDTLRMFGYHLITYEIGKLVSKVHGTSMKHITKKDLAKIESSFPSIPEQERINQVLNDAQLEIDEIEADIQKLRTEKKALMQQLLTGKRRVVVDA